ncbi:MAG TPA: YhjD/YihY/BrkB family envelope integrity protein [Acidimicrobiales bacterium]|jgi:YihY family inner membrane protein
MPNLNSVQAKVDAWQRRTPPVAVAFAVNKKFGDDSLGLMVVALGWYGFLAIYPLLLVVVTVLGYVGVSSLGSGLVQTLHQFPVVGNQFNPEHAGHNLHGSIAGLVIGLVGLVYGATGVMQTAQTAMAQAWNVPKFDRPGFVPRLGRSLLGLIVIGGSFVVNAAIGAYATGSSEAPWERVLALIGMLILNALAYFGAFRVLTPKEVSTRSLLPGAIFGAVGFTTLITVGSGLVDHQLRHSSSTYGQFGAVIGLVGFLLLLGRISLFGAELNPVLARHLWPRALVARNLTDADRAVLRAQANETRQHADSVVDVGFSVDDSVAPASETPT